MALSNLMCSVHKSGNLQGCLSGQVFFDNFIMYGFITFSLMKLGVILI